MSEPVDFIGKFETNEDLARKLDLVITQIVGTGSPLPEASMKVLHAAVQRIRLFTHPESL